MQGLNEMAIVQVIHTEELRKALGYKVKKEQKEWHPVLLTTLICSTLGVILSHGANYVG